MTLLTDDQRQLADMTRSFLAEEGTIKTQLRHWRDTGCKDGFGHALWKQMAELGLTGLAVPEEEGGLGLGATEAALVMEEVGRNLTPSPFLTTALVTVEALKGTGQGKRWFPGILAGDAIAAVAVDEGKHHRPRQIAMEARRSGNGFALSGTKQFVVHGASADLIIVAARTGGSAGESEGLTLFAVERGAAGLGVENATLADSSKAARLTFDNVEVDADAVIGEVDGGWEPLRRAMRVGRTGAAAELVGVAAGASAMTVDYLKQRKQFGKLIGEFQVLQHRAAHLYGEIEIARAATWKAAELLDRQDERAGIMSHVAKAKAGRVSALAVQEGVQMHGGIGMTDEHDIGLFMKREKVLDSLFGDANYHARMVQVMGG
jgi:alkylation response protein AidB-like acyl-CoA dehydrogenase